MIAVFAGAVVFTDVGTTSCFADSSLVLAQALERVQNGDLSGASLILEKVPVSSKDYPQAFLELQKINYKEGRWDSFFGYATFYRKSLEEKFFQPDLIILEIMALLKHCQVNVAKLVADTTTNLIIERHLSLDEGAKAKLSAAQDLIELQSKFLANVQTEAVSSPFRAFSPTLQWKIKAENRNEVLDQVIHSPKDLRVYVKNICKVGPSS